MSNTREGNLQSQPSQNSPQVNQDSTTSISQDQEPHLDTQKKSNKLLKIFFYVSVSIILVAGGWWVWKKQIIKAPKGICGLEGGRRGYSTAYCDRSCRVDNDCQFACGCGAINKNEVCHDEGIIYDCVDHETKCEKGKCVLGKEMLSAKVTITTDKKEYERGEIIKITVKNNLNKPIWYIKETCSPSCCALHKLENNTWKSLGVPFPCVQLTYPGGIIEPDRLSFGGEIKKQLDTKGRGEFAESVKYRFSFYYGLSKDNFTEKTIYSNEFTIKEKKEIACSQLNEEQCRNQLSCIPLGNAIVTYFERGETETFLFEECVDRVPEYKNCKEVVKMPQMRGGTLYPKECRCCCGEGPFCKESSYPEK